MLICGITEHQFFWRRGISERPAVESARTAWRVVLFTRTISLHVSVHVLACHVLVAIVDLVQQLFVLQVEHLILKQTRICFFVLQLLEALLLLGRVADHLVGLALLLLHLVVD